MTTSGSRIFVILLMCFACCVAVDIFYFPKTTIFPDEIRFLNSARAIVQTGKFDVAGDRAFEMPGTAIFFAAFIKLFGAQAALISIRIAQAILVVVQAWLIGTIAQRIFNDRCTALIAAAIASFYPLLIYFQGLLLSETLFNTFLVAGFASLYWWRERGCRIEFSFLLACIMFASATMTKATLTMVPPLFFAALILCERGQIVQATRILIVSTVVYCALLAPWWIRNYSVLGEFVPFTTGAGPNLYLGNNPANRDGGIDWAHDTDPHRAATMMAIPSETERGRAFTAEAIKYIRQEPGIFVERMGQKFLRYWNPIPNASAFRGISFVLISAASFGPILLFALVSTVRNRRRFGALIPIYVLIGYFTVVHIVVIASIRYRLPLEPFLILLASEPIAKIVTAIRNFRRARVG